MKRHSSARARHSFIEILESRIAPATFTYVGGLAGAWNNQNNWRNETTGGTNGFPGSGSSQGGEGDVVFFNGSASPVVTLSADVIIHSLFFTGTGNTTITGQTLNFVGNTAGANIAVLGAGHPVINSNISSSSALPLTITNGGPGQDLDLNGALSSGFSGNPTGFGGFIKTGSGKLTLGGSASNTFPNSGAGAGFTVSGGVTFFSKTGGALAIPATASADGITDLEILTGGVLITNSEQIADTANVNLTSPGTFGMFASETINKLSGSGEVNGVANTRLTLKETSNFAGYLGTPGVAAQFDVAIAAGEVLSLIGTQPAGTHGLVRIVGGQLNVIGTYADTDLVLASGGANDPGVLSGTGTIGDVSTAGSSIIAPGTGVLTPGTGNGFGALTVEDLTSTGFGNLAVNLDVTSVGADRIILGGSVAHNVVTQFISNGVPVSEGLALTIYDVPGTAQHPLLTGITFGGTIGLVAGDTVALSSTDSPLVIQYNGGNGNDIVLVATPKLTPIAPTSISGDGKTATFLQADGDLLTIKATKGKFTAANFTFSALPSGGTTAGRLETIDVSAANFGTAFKGATLTGTVTKGANGDGFAEIGWVDATGVDLAGVKLPGRLGKITAGDSTLATAGVGSLSVLSLGSTFAALNYNPNAAALYTSDITGRLGKLSVTTGKLNTANTPTLPSEAGLILQAFVSVNAGPTVASYKSAGIGSIVVDSLTGINFTGNMQTLFAGNGEVTYTPGSIRADGAIGPVTVSGNLNGGSSDYSGVIGSRTSIGAVTLNGTKGSGGISGGDGFDSGAIFVGSPDDSSQPGGKMGAVKLAGSLTGSTGINSGTLYADKGIGAIAIGGALVGGTASTSGSIVSGAGLASVKITGTLQTGGAPFSGSIVAFGGNIGAISIGTMDVASTAGGTQVGIISSGNIASLTSGALTSTSGGLGVISAFGKVGGGNAIGKVTLKASVAHWGIVAGFDPTVDLTGTQGGTFNPDASIGTVNVAGSFTGAITAGTLWGVDGVAGVNDTHLPGDVKPTVVARIAKITIAGQATDSAFEAQRITTVKIAGAAAQLTKGTDDLIVGQNSVLTEIP